MTSATRAHSLAYDFPGLSSYQLPGVTVFVRGPGVDTSVVTDATGTFQFRGPFQAADYALEFRIPGFATMRRTVTAVPMGVASVSLQMRFCDMADAVSHNEPYLIDWVRSADAIVHFRIDAAEQPRPAQEAGEGHCGGQEVRVVGRSLRTSKLVSEMPEPAGFVLRQYRFEGDPQSFVESLVGREYVVFFHWLPEIGRFVPRTMLPVTDGRLSWRREGGVLTDGMPVSDAIAALAVRQP